MHKVGTYKVSHDCNIHLYESINYGNVNDYRKQIETYKEELSEYHEEWNSSAWNELSEQVSCSSIKH